MMNKKTFSFQHVTSKEIVRQTNLLDKSKPQQQEDIPTRIIKENANIFSNFISQSFNSELDNLNFPDLLKHADVKPAHKKDSKFEKNNYRPISILPKLV